MKCSKIFALLTAALLLLSSSALAASGEASGASEEQPVEALVEVTAEGTELDLAGYDYALAAGDVGESAMTGVELTTDDYYMNIVNVAGGSYTLQDCVISKGVSETAEAAGGVIAKVTDGLLVIRDSALTTAGKGGIRFADYPVE